MCTQTVLEMIVLRAVEATFCRYIIKKASFETSALLIQFMNKRYFRVGMRVITEHFTTLLASKMAKAFSISQQIFFFKAGLERSFHIRFK